MSDDLDISLDPTNPNQQPDTAKSVRRVLGTFTFICGAIGGLLFSFNQADTMFSNIAERDRLESELQQTKAALRETREAKSQCELKLPGQLHEVVDHLREETIQLQNALISRLNQNNSKQGMIIEAKELLLRNCGCD
ncbi:MAG TPA: hypothetical protein VJA27_00785 [Patescibacteria group bacterium]|nr:hypothetical protein [Patescibacteria group bacterium]